MFPNAVFVPINNNGLSNALISEHEWYPLAMRNYLWSYKVCLLLMVFCWLLQLGMCEILKSDLQWLILQIANTPVLFINEESLRFIDIE